MSENTETNSKTPEAAPKRTRKASKKAKAVKAASRGKKARKPKADRANKKAEVIAMMKRAKGATLAEIMAATRWKAHTVRGYSLLASGINCWGWNHQTKTLAG
jgi:hypothetical protein